MSPTVFGNYTKKTSSPASSNTSEDARSNREDVLSDSKGTTNNSNSQKVFEKSDDTMLGWLENGLIYQKTKR